MRILFSPTMGLSLPYFGVIDSLELRNQMLEKQWLALRKANTKRNRLCNKGQILVNKSIAATTNTTWVSPTIENEILYIQGYATISKGNLIFQEAQIRFLKAVKVECGRDARILWGNYGCQITIDDEGNEIDFVY